MHTTGLFHDLTDMIPALFKCLQRIIFSRKLFPSTIHAATAEVNFTHREFSQRIFLGVDALQNLEVTELSGTFVLRDRQFAGVLRA